MSGQNEVLSLLAKLKPHASVFRKVRVGACGDGGYVLPDDLDGLSAVLSLGVGFDTSFDEHFARRDVPVYQYDPTVEGPPAPHPLFQFNKIAWAPSDGPEALCLDSIVRRHGLEHTTDAVLKFDVEGPEWTCLPAISPDLLKLFRIVVCELHGLNAMHNRDFLVQMAASLNVLTRNHTVVHLHANNCCGATLVEGVPVPAVVELTLLRNDRSRFTHSDDPIPGPLDWPNMSDRPDLVLRPFG